MKTIGIIGGISWHSTAIYYKMINELVQARLGGSNAARLLLHSINYNDFKVLQENNNWQQIEKMLTGIAIQLQNAGADCIMISCNAAHIVADELARKINVPFLHIAEATAEEIQKQGISYVALTGTKFTMENTFFSDRLSANNIQTLLPEKSDREFIHSFILNELSKGIINPKTKARFIEIIHCLKSAGADAVILGCTELGMLINPSEVQVKIFDTTDVHCRKSVKFALSDKITSL